MRVAISLLVLFSIVNALPHFPSTSVWYQDVSTSALNPNSTAIIQWLVSAGGFGYSRFQVDFSFHVLEADASTPKYPFVKNPGYYLPDCDEVPSVPLPAGGRIEGETGYTCTTGGDCHLLVADKSSGLLYESYISSVNAGQLTSTCLAVWNLNRTYPATLRGDQCTSADAAGFPISALLFSADEIYSGVIDHAIRFILPNARMRKGYYVRPATHAGGPSATSVNAPVYGSRFRLKASFNETKLNPAARVVARALKKYGMVLADGGNIALTAQNDYFTTHKWAEVGFDSRSLTAITPADFEVVNTGPNIPLTYNCARSTFAGYCPSTFF